MGRATFYLTIIYSLIVIVLGTMGYARAGSKISIVVSSIIGSFIIFFSFFSLYLKKMWPFFLVLLAVLALLGFFIYRFATTKQFMPGAMSMFSALIATLITIWLVSREKI